MVIFLDVFGPHWDPLAGHAFETPALLIEMDFDR